jgi:hypothetical protein
LLLLVLLVLLQSCRWHGLRGWQLLRASWAKPWREPLWRCRLLLRLRLVLQLGSLGKEAAEV